MSWDCPHQRGRETMCALRRRVCEPLAEGCVLAGRFRGLICKEEGQEMKTTEQNAGGAPAEKWADATVGDVAAAHPALRPLLERLGIDYCCGGKKPFAAAVSETGHDLRAVLDECRGALQAAAGGAEATDWRKVSVTALADHIFATHHAFTREQLARIDGLLARVQRAHGAKHGAMLREVRQVFDALRTELLSGA